MGLRLRDTHCAAWAPIALGPLVTQLLPPAGSAQVLSSGDQCEWVLGSSCACPLYDSVGDITQVTMDSSGSMVTWWPWLNQGSA